MHPAKSQISLGIRPVWSESSLCAQLVVKSPMFLHADSNDSDQTGHPPRLWVFAGCTGNFVGFFRVAAHSWAKTQESSWRGSIKDSDQPVNQHRLNSLYTPPQTLFVVGYTVFTSVRPCMCLSVTLWFFPNILKTQWWIFIISADTLISIRCTYIWKSKG